MAQSSAHLPYSYARHLPLKPLSTEKSPYSWFRLPLPADTEVPPGAICWGTVGEMPSPEPLPTFDFNVKKDEHKEVNRKEDEVRIENPDEPSQYIIVKRAAEINFETITRGGTAAGTNTSAEKPAGVAGNSSYVPVASATEKKGTLKVQLNNGPQSL